MRTNISLLRTIFGFSAIPLFCMLTGCFHNYYKAGNIDANTFTQNVTAGQYANRYFILRNGNNSYGMSNLMVSEDRKTLTCHLESVPDEHSLDLLSGQNGNMRYKKSRGESEVLNEVHLYIPADNSAKLNEDYTFTLDKVLKIEVLEKDKGRTTTSYILGGVGYTIGAVVVAAVIAVALKSSCPFVSAYDGTQMQLQGEIYGGAIYPQLCRNDFIGLNMQPNGEGKLQLQISNELKEKQFTDLAELLVISHDKNVKVVADEKGNFHSISNPVFPISAIANNRDVMPLIKNENDNLSFNFDDTLAAKANNNILLLSFDKPASVVNAKLVMRLKNSYWLDMVYGKFTQGFGSYYTTFIQKQHNAPVEKLNTWKTEQQLPLTISVLRNNELKVQQTLTTFGPLATRETAIPIDLSNIKDGKINIAISTGFMFWEIDYAAIDFSDDAALTVTKLLPEKATDETGKDVKQLLNQEDGKFLEQPVPGNATVIEYAFTPSHDKNKTQTYILHAKGYYEHLRDYKTKMDLNFLQQFKQAGALSKYSMTLYQQAINNNLNTLAKQ